MTPALYDNLTYDVVHDLAPVATVGGGSFVMVIGPGLPARTVQEFVDYAKANPRKLNFGFGQGTLPQVLGESLKAMSGADIASIPYKGGAGAVADMLGGRIQLNFGTVATLLPLIQQDRIRALAVTSAERNRDLPEVPTMAESGFPGLQLNFWMGVWAPARTPTAIVEKLNGEINASLQASDLTAAMAKIGFAPMPQSRRSFEAQIQTEAPKWLAVAKASGIKGD
jgi:tripartite-type tricarboxylate transporter receptor subunit TctC